MDRNQIIIDKITKQFLCLKNPLVRITAPYPRGVDEGKPWNLCKDRDTGVETLWSLQDVIHNLPLLYKLNATGRNIFVTPHESNEWIYMLIDDVRQSFYEAGFKPNLLIESSKNSVQAVFVLKNIYPRRKYIDMFHWINNEMYGDQSISGLRHPFRLLGFANQKPEHRQEDGSFPFTRLISRSQKFCPTMSALADEFCGPSGPSLLTVSEIPIPSPVHVPAPDIDIVQKPEKSPTVSLWRTIRKEIRRPLPRTKTGHLTANTDTEAAYIKHAEDIRQHDPNLANTKIDYRVAERLITTGHETQDIIDAVDKRSGRQRPDNLSYAVGTVKNAASGAVAQKGKRNLYLRIESC